MTGSSSWRRVFRLPAAWRRCGMGLKQEHPGLDHRGDGMHSQLPETRGAFGFLVAISRLPPRTMHRSWWS